MIRKLTNFDPYWDFIHEINGDPDYSEPMLQTEEQIESNLKRAQNSPDHHAFGVFSGEEMTGLFVFLILNDEQYIEMLVGLSRSPAACEEIADWLQAHYPGFQVDFVFNPKNPAIREMLVHRGAAFSTEQQKMVLTSPVPAVDTTGIEPLSERYRDPYIAMHSTDVYWTGDKVANALDTFNVFLAIDNGTVVGYIDVTKDGEENEPFDFLVKADCRRHGWGRKLLSYAIEANRPKGMMLIVDVDNEPAVALYRSMGFTVDPHAFSQVATWHIS